MPHDPDFDANIDEIESLAPVAVAFWLEESEQILDRQFGAGYAEKNPSMLVGFLAACSTVYAAERMQDAASIIAAVLDAEK